MDDFTVKQKTVLKELSDGKPHRAVFFDSSAAISLTRATNARTDFVKTWLAPRNADGSGAMLRWFQLAN